MKRSLIIASFLTLPWTASVAWAANDTPGMSGGKRSMTTNDESMQGGMMQDHMLLMHKKMHQIDEAKNPQERERLMKEHAQMMQDHMQGVHDMKSGQKRGQDMKGNMRPGHSMDGMKGGDMKGHGMESGDKNRPQDGGMKTP